MAFNKRAGLWVVPDRMYIGVKVASELWYYSRRDGSGERQTHLFFCGWYSTPGVRGALFTLTVLWLTVQLGLAVPASTKGGDQ